MRVTHVITRLIVGGAQENTVATVLGLRRKPGVIVKLISGPTTGPEGSLESRFADSPGLLSLSPELVRPIHPWKDLLALRDLAVIFRRDSPDIVHTHSGKAGILGRLAAHRARVPIIVHTIHGPSFGSFQGSLANFAFGSAERYAAKFTSHFVAVAQAMTEQYLAAGIGRREQYTRIFSGFPLEPYLGARNDPGLRRRLGIAPDDFVIGKIARLFKGKGHDDLFGVAPTLIQRWPRMKFLLVGDGRWKERFQRLARASGLENRFVFTGLVTPEEIPGYVGIMDVLVHLSRREGLPRALPQALAAARPIVAYDCDGAREVCLENETGFLVKPGDRSALVQRLLQLASDSSLRERFGSEGRRLVKAWFPVERMVDCVYALYLELAGQHNRSSANERTLAR
ncbi:MAG: glycosyltransferase family 4 protein [Verrucomicrobiota bacterium]